MKSVNSAINENSAIHELCRRVESGDPEATRRCLNQITPLVKLQMSRSQSTQDRGSAPEGESCVMESARKWCRAILARLQARPRAKQQDDTLDGRSAWLTIKTW
ncbi:MAG TPA: hypothetical protein VGX76_21080 [Pirellulales bacterium]|jgi:hypothetical protein|nr:hypothetical protein [Pirellulales bacterium]